MAGLKIDSTESRAHFTVTTSTTGPFVINFGNLGKSELEVYVGENTKLADAAWNFTPVTTQSGNPLDFGSAGGSISLVTPVANTTVTVVGRQRTRVDTDFASHADFSFPALNASIARLTLMVRDYKEQVSRLPQYPEGDQLSIPQYFPAKSARAEHVPYWDANGLIQVGPLKVDVETVASIADEIAALAEPSIVSGIIALSPAEVIAGILALDSLPAEISALGAIVTEIDTLGSPPFPTHLSTLGAIAADITTAAGIAGKITIAADNSADITTAADNIAAIIAAPAAAAEAAAWSDADVDQPVEGQGIITFNPATAINLATNVITIAGNTLLQDEPVTYRNGGGTAPPGLTHDAQYWVVNKSGNDFALSATRGGSPVDITGAGAGTTHQLLPVRSAKDRAHYARQSELAARADAVDAAATLAQLTTVHLGNFANASAAWAAPDAATGSIYFDTTLGANFVLGAAAPAADRLAPPKATTAQARAGTEDTAFITSKTAHEAFLTGKAVLSVPAAGIAGTGDAITLSVTGGAPIADGLTISFLPKAANTGGVTLNYNSGGAVELLDVYGAALTAGALLSTAPIIVRYDGAASKWRLVGSAPDALITATGSTAARALSARFAEVTNVKDFGAIGDGLADDTAASQAAFAYAAANGKCLFFPRGTYGVTTTIGTINSSDWLIFGEDPTGTIIKCSGDTDVFKIDVSAANLFRVQIKNVELFNSHVTGANATGVRVVANSASATGLKESRFQDVRFRGMGLAGVYIEEAGRVDDGAGNISIQPHSFIEFLDLHFPQHTRYPTDCIRWEAGNGPHNQIRGGRFRCAGYGFRFGNGLAGHGVGDFTCVGVHFLLGLAAFKIQGPSDDQYRTSINVVGCQFDGMSSFVYDIDRLDRVNIQGNNFKVGVDASITNCDLTRSIVETRDEVYCYGARFDYFSGQTDTLQIIGGDSVTQSAGMRVSSTNTNASLDFRGKGSGKVFLAAHYGNFVGVLGSASGTATATVQAVGADTNIHLEIEGKGTGEVRAATNRSNYILLQGANNGGGVTVKPEAVSDTTVALNLFAKGAAPVVVAWVGQSVAFFGGAGAAKQTVSGSRGSNAALTSLLTALANYGLITNSST